MLTDPSTTSYTNPNLQPQNLELTPEREKALIEFGDWWGDRLIVTREELSQSTEFLNLQSRYGRGYPYYTLLTHNCGNETKKEGIVKLGGVIYWPDTQQTQYYGSDAAKQLKASLGITGTGQTAYGGVKDGHTFVYLHPIPPELFEDTRVYLAGPEGFALAKAFSSNPPNWNRSRFELESILQAPWVALDTWLTEEKNLDTLIKYLPQYRVQLLEYPNFRYQLRMTENRYLIGIV